MTKLAQSFAILSAIAVGLVSPGALAGTIKDSGAIDATYVKRDAQAIPDQEAMCWC